MAATQKSQKNDRSMVAGWSAAGLVIGLACGYFLLESVFSGILLGIGLGLAMGMAGKSTDKKSK